MKRSFLGLLATILFAIVVSYPIGSWAQSFTFSTLYSFKNNGKDPVSPEGFLIIDSEGNLYGTSLAGGTFGLGTVYEVTKTGKLSVLHSFKGSPTDGRGGQYIPAPLDGLARDTAGNLYGTTLEGGNSNKSSSCSPAGCGVVFKVAPSGTETILYNFPAYAQPSNVILDSEGNLYGTTAYGGIGNGGTGYGTVYEIKDETFSVLYDFCAASGCEDGSIPFSGLVRDSAGDLYGTTIDGGAAGQGTVFKLTPSGIETVLHSFPESPSDGISPEGNLKQDSKGNLYGVTQQGDSGNGGVLYEQPENGAEETILYDFCTAGCAASAPVGPVQIDKSGNFYGSGSGFDKQGNGTPVIWEVNSARQETVLYTFPYVENNTVGGLIIDSEGNLYGTADGGTTGSGSVFKLTLVK